LIFPPSPPNLRAYTSQSHPVRDFKKRASSRPDFFSCLDRERVRARVFPSLLTPRFPQCPFYSFVPLLSLMLGRVSLPNSPTFVSEHFLLFFSSFLDLPQAPRRHATTRSAPFQLPSSSPVAPALLPPFGLTFFQLLDFFFSFFFDPESACLLSPRLSVVCACRFLLSSRWLRLISSGSMCSFFRVLNSGSEVFASSTKRKSSPGVEHVFSSGAPPPSKSQNVHRVGVNLPSRCRFESYTPPPS